uniref:Uncharacterized protein n=1 Tax=Rhizophora mucronata TaxID=61149 RepID=A0A2P2R273_RHIMU
MVSLSFLLKMPIT